MRLGLKKKKKKKKKKKLSLLKGLCSWHSQSEMKISCSTITWAIGTQKWLSDVEDWEIEPMRNMVGKMGKEEG